jgi:hypothetical protein
LEAIVTAYVPKLGDLVAIGDAVYVAVDERVDDGKVMLCKCGSLRWFVPSRYPISDVTSASLASKNYRRACRWLDAVKPGLDGWKRIAVGRYGQIREVVVGHVDVPWRRA